MAIIPPTIDFEGSDTGKTYRPIPYVFDEVKKAIFNKKSNPDGANVYFLPAYKQDRNGGGVWYNKINIRDNFGAKFKEKYYVPDPEKDPANYFARNFRYLYPEDAKPVDTEVNGMPMKKYPNCGKSAERVLFNVAFHKDMQAGAHLLDLPYHNGADKLLNWLRTPDINGNRRRPINDPNRCVPVLIKMTVGGKSPWTLDPDSEHPAKLPIALADAENLIDLDNIFIIKSNEEIISTLRDMYTPEVFDNCMNGFPGLNSRAVQGATLRRPVQEKAAPVAQVVSAVEEPEIYQFPEELEVDRPFVSANENKKTPVDNHLYDDNDDDELLAEAVVRKPVLRAPVTPVNAPPASGVSATGTQRMSRMTREEAMNWINQE